MNIRSPRWLLAILALVALSLAVAAPNSVTISALPGGVQVRGETQLRFFVDYATLTVNLPEATLSNADAQIQGVKIETGSDGLKLGFAERFALAVPPDGRTLTVGAPGITGPVTVSSADRSPVVFFLSYAQPAVVANLISRLYPGLRVEVDERQRAVVVMLVANERPDVESLIRVLDAPRPQVMFEAEILEINRNMAQQLGIDYSKLINVNFRFTEQNPPVGSLLGFGQFGRAPFSLELGINLLKTTGSARSLAKPRIATIEGLEAKINSTQTIPLVIKGENNTQTIQNITTGINLRMLPRVTPEQTIETQLSIAVSSPTGTTPSGVPQYSTREANTTVRVRNAETIVIGGLLESRRATAASGIPGLMDIPIVGEIFKTTTTQEVDTDLIIVVTPFIIGSALTPNAAPPPSSAPNPTPPARPSGQAP